MRAIAYTAALSLFGCTAIPYLHPDSATCAAVGSPIASLITSSMTALVAAAPIAKAVCDAAGTTPTTTQTVVVKAQASAGPPSPVPLGITGSPVTVTP